jgi:hypothetical protein
MTYPDPEIFYTACSKLSWSDNRLIMRDEDAKTRAYYLPESDAQQWTVRQLECMGMSLLVYGLVGHAHGYGL